jgi:hypothetical protein
MLKQSLFKNKHSNLFYGCLLFISLSACTKNSTDIPSDIIPKDSMVYIMMDVHLAEAAVKTAAADTNYKLNIRTYYDHIYKKYNTTDSNFNKSLKFYTDNPELLEQIYQKIAEEMSRKEAEVFKQQ